MAGFKALEFTSWQERRIDEVETAVYDCLLVITEKNENEFPWDMHYVGPVADMICDFLVANKIPVRYPAIIYETPDDDGHISNWHSDFRGDNNDTA